MCVCVVTLIAALALAVAPACANAASPVLEFAAPGNGFPVSFTADGGPVTAALAGFEPVVQCAGSHGEGEITGPRSTLSNYVFTGCEAQGGTHSGHECKSAGASAEEIKSETMEAELVYIDQARHEVGMLLNPHGGIYMNFECGGESVNASGPFLSPVGPINEVAMSFTAILSRSGTMQIPNEYENANGEKLQAIPTGEREGQPPATTGVELSFAIHPSASLEIRAVTAEEIEAKQREEEAAAAKKRQEAEGTKSHKPLTRAQLRSKALKRCRKVKSKHRRIRCENRVKKKYGGHSGGRKHGRQD